MKSIFSRLTSVLALAVVLAAPAVADVTNIATVPLSTLADTGTVRPNIMLIYDNSGSMAWNYTPDYINNASTCRSTATMGTTTSKKTTACVVGHPPFNSSDFNKQYYNPAVTYTPPVYSTGVSYPNITSWTSVANDAYGIDRTQLRGTSTANVNLTTGFPDLQWCSGTTCKANTAGYSYPDNTYTTSLQVSTNPYYYTIMVSEYCTDANLTTCVSVPVGAAAPTGYPNPAKVRFCNTVELTNCQAKYVGAYIYPRFGDPSRTNASIAYGTLTVPLSTNVTSRTVTSVSSLEPGATTPVVITNVAATASGGTPDNASQSTLATAIAASIIAKNGLAKQYLACVRTPAPTTSTVPACSTYGITLGADNIVAVIPITCIAGATAKNLTQCATVTDTSRNGAVLSVNASDATAVTPGTTRITVTGTGVTSTSTSNRTSLTSLKLGTTTLYSGTLTFATGASATTAATAIAGAISATGVTATSGTASGCSAAVVCLSFTSTISSSATLTSTFTKNTVNPPLALALGTITQGTPAGTATPNFAPTAVGSSVFVRTDIIPARTSYPMAVTRTDCAGTTCTYTEEMTNFANWYTYYKTRNQAMKTSVGLAFNPITSSYNIGVVSLAVAATTTSTMSTAPFSAPVQFSSTNKATFYNNLYNMATGGATPMRVALDAVGQMYANIKPFNFSGTAQAVQFPCQQNFTFITTDGYWNGAPSAAVLNNDNVENAARFCTLDKGCVDPSAQQYSSLADVALYWYNGGTNGTTVSLRPDIETSVASTGQVRGPAGDNTHLHMNTYALGLGIDGVMNFEPDYDLVQKAGGDFANLINGVQTGCPWNNNGPYVWPDPVTTDDAGGASYQSRVDDLWHTAINGRGKYFSASDPTQVIAGLRDALSHIAQTVGASSSAATSTPNITLLDNDVFSNTFTSVQWSGDLTDKKIDAITGAIGATAQWSAASKLGTMVSAGSDSRNIWMLDPTAKVLKPFSVENFTGSDLLWFTNRCADLLQCSRMTAANKVIANAPANLIGWLRGQQQYADNTVFRSYGQGTAFTNPDTSVTPAGPLVLGDIASSQPAYVRVPNRSYALAGYPEFVTLQSGRAGAVYVGANDGMLHAFDGATGKENWAYVPRFIMKKLALQASTDYGVNHQFTVDGSPVTNDVQFAIPTNANPVTAWHTVLVSGMNGGGRGYFAIDVTDPANPKGLWETCADVAICTGANNAPDMGLTFGNPQMGTWRDPADGKTKWVVFVTSGYNNVPPAAGGTDPYAVNAGSGLGILYVLDIQTGAILAKQSTGVGSTDTPSGLARITGITADPATDPKITFIYGGDLLGNMWRFDTTTLTATAAGAPVLLGASTAAQPITVRPDVTLCAVTTTPTGGVATTTNQVVVAYGTGRLLGITDVSNHDLQSIYVVKDAATSISAAAWRGSTMTPRPVTKQSNGSYTVSGDAVDLSSKIGWYTDLNQNQGERVNLDPKIVTGTLDVFTNVPDSSAACSVGGTGNLYQFDVCKGTGDTNGVVGNKVADKMAVGYDVFGLPSGAKKIIVTLADGTQVVLDAGSGKSPVSRRTGWRRIRN